MRAGKWNDRMNYIGILSKNHLSITFNDSISSTDFFLDSRHVA